MRASQSLGPTKASVLHKWLLMGGLAAGVLLVAAGAAVYEARRLSRPVEGLTVAVSRLGDGDFTVRAEPSGVPEIDQAGNAVNATAERLGTMIERERAFSGDASHQLRTPLTGLRLHLENALADPTGEHTEALNDALGAVERLEATVVDLLALARGTTPIAEPIDVAAVVADQVGPWRPLVTNAGRRLKLDYGDDLPKARVSPGAVRQIVDVLVSNALVHGGGTITVDVIDATGAIAVNVLDEGAGVTGDTDRIFLRGEGVHHGIGLSLARSLAEAESGRLILRNPGPHPCFSLLLPSDEAS
jgi:signal transduction histidine kinase